MSAHARSDRVATLSTFGAHHPHGGVSEGGQVLIAESIAIAILRHHFFVGFSALDVFGVGPQAETGIAGKATAAVYDTVAVAIPDRDELFERTLCESGAKGIG